MAPASEDDYLLGTDERELERLRFQHEVWGEHSRQFFKRLRVRKGWKCLDVGGGPGFVTMDLAKLVGQEGEVTLLEPSMSFVAWFRQHQQPQLDTPVRVIQARVEEAELPEQAYDLIFVRWVIAFSANPEAFLEKLVRALKPGGSIAIQDYFFEGLALFPKGGPFDQVPDLVRAYYHSDHGDPYVTGKIPAWFRKYGLEVTDFTPNSLAGGPDSKIMEWASRFYELHLPRMVEKKLVSAEQADAILADLAEHRRNPDALFFSPVVIDVAGTLPGKIRRGGGSQLRMANLFGQKN